MSDVDIHHLDDVLAEMVSHHILEPEQAGAVHDAMVRSAAAPYPPEAGPASPLGRRLVEAAAYLGGVLVAASLLALVAQTWDGLAETSRVLVLGGLGILAVLIGLAVVLTGDRARATAATSARRRVAGVLLVLGSLLVAGAVLVRTVDLRFGVLVAGLVAVALVAASHRLAPGVVPDLALLAATLVALIGGVAPLVPDRADWIGDTMPPVRLWDFALPVAIMLLGLVWAWVVARVMWQPTVVTVAALLVALAPAFAMSTDEWTRAGGVVMLVVLVLCGVASFVALRTWPWLVLAVLAATVAVFVLVAGAGNPVVAFLVSGLVLLGGAGCVAVLLRRRDGSAAALRQGADAW